MSDSRPSQSTTSPAARDLKTALFLPPVCSVAHTNPDALVRACMCSQKCPPLPPTSSINTHPRKIRVHKIKGELILNCSMKFVAAKDKNKPLPLPGSVRRRFWLWCGPSLTGGRTPGQGARAPPPSRLTSISAPYHRCSII